MVNMMQAMFQRRQGFCHLITKHSGSCFLSLNLPSKNLSPFREESVLRQIPRSVYFNFPSFKKKKKFPVQTEDQYAQSFITFEEIHSVALWLLTPVKHWNHPWNLNNYAQVSPLG